MKAGKSLSFTAPRFSALLCGQSQSPEESRVAKKTSMHNQHTKNRIFTRRAAVIGGATFAEFCGAARIWWGCSWRRNSWFLILDNHVKNKKYGNFVSISSLTGKCATQKFYVYGHVYIIWSLRSQHKNHRFFDDFRPGHVPLNKQFSPTWSCGPR